MSYGYNNSLSSSQSSTFPDTSLAYWAKQVDCSDRNDELVQIISQLSQQLKEAESDQRYDRVSLIEKISMENRWACKHLFFAIDSWVKYLMDKPSFLPHSSIREPLLEIINTANAKNWTHTVTLAARITHNSFDLPSEFFSSSGETLSVSTRRPFAESSGPAGARGWKQMADSFRYQPSHNFVASRRGGRGESKQPAPSLHTSLPPASHQVATPKQNKPYVFVESSDGQWTAEQPGALENRSAKGGTENTLRRSKMRGITHGTSSQVSSLPTSTNPRGLPHPRPPEWQRSSLYSSHQGQDPSSSSQATNGTEGLSPNDEDLLIFGLMNKDSKMNPPSPDLDWSFSDF